MTRDSRSAEERIDAAARAVATAPADNGSDAVLRLMGVSRIYGDGEQTVTALSGVDLDIRAGELVAIMGSSGSGKSTLLSIAGGLQQPSAGEVLVEGRALLSLDAKET